MAMVGPPEERHNSGGWGVEEGRGGSGVSDSSCVSHEGAPATAPARQLQAATRTRPCIQRAGSNFIPKAGRGRSQWAAPDHHPSQPACFTGRGTAAAGGRLAGGGVSPPTTHPHSRRLQHGGHWDGVRRARHRAMEGPRGWEAACLSRASGSHRAPCAHCAEHRAHHALQHTSQWLRSKQGALPALPAPLTRECNHPQNSKEGASQASSRPSRVHTHRCNRSSCWELAARGPRRWWVAAAALQAESGARDGTTVLQGCGKRCPAGPGAPQVGWEAVVSTCWSSWPCKRALSRWIRATICEALQSLRRLWVLENAPSPTPPPPPTSFRYLPGPLQHLWSSHQYNYDDSATNAGAAAAAQRRRRPYLAAAAVPALPARRLPPWRGLPLLARPCC